MSRPGPTQRTPTADDVAGCLRASLGPGRRTVAMPSRGIRARTDPRRHASRPTCSAATSPASPGADAVAV
ncbi:hypothetical protein ACIBTZ_23440 [Micromonospora sp. NPDC049460]|uniref:hypothetical protein n=1 Tax=Micromonospora sp. NPDC049460 TaxID=3364272 RepID=UPI00379F1280